MPRDREGRFSTEPFDRYQRSEKALVSALAEMYVQGVSTRKVKAITGELCGHTFSASTVSRINRSLGGLLQRFAQRRLEEAYPYVILDARYEKVRLDGVIQSQAVFIALGINGEGRRQGLGGDLAKPRVALELAAGRLRQRILRVGEAAVRPYLVRALAADPRGPVDSLVRRQRDGRRRKRRYRQLSRLATFPSPASTERIGSCFHGFPPPIGGEPVPRGVGTAGTADLLGLCGSRGWEPLVL